MRGAPAAGPAAADAGREPPNLAAASTAPPSAPARSTARRDTPPASAAASLAASPAAFRSHAASGVRVMTRNPRRVPDGKNGSGAVATRSGNFVEPGPRVTHLPP